MSGRQSDDLVAEMRRNEETWEDGKIEGVPEVGPIDRHPDALWLVELRLLPDDGRPRLLCEHHRVSAHTASRLLHAGIEIGIAREKARRDAR